MIQNFTTDITLTKKLPKNTLPMQIPNYYYQTTITILLFYYTTSTTTTTTTLLLLQ